MMSDSTIIYSVTLSNLLNFIQMLHSKKISLCLVLFGACALSFFSSCHSNSTNSSNNSDSLTTGSKSDSAGISVNVQKIGDEFEALTNVAFPGNGDMWVLEQAGKIWIIRNGKRLDAPLMDMTSKIVKMHNGYEERGLLGIAFHPQFTTNKKFYLFYSRPSATFNHTGVVAEYTLTDQLPVDPNSGRIILTVDEPDGNHNGGCIKFGPDGYLYVSFGDGGGQHDQHGTIGNGQDMNTLLGKILRIDVNTEDTYKIPDDNPFVGKPNVRPEIWAYGFRNPYRFSFDKVSGQLFAGDVGQDLWEEVDIVKKGANYGWRIMEGTHCHNLKNIPDSTCDTSGITMPIDEYSHTIGVSVMGGYVYNGKQLPVLQSKYVFADWTGPVFYLQKWGDKWKRGNIKLQNIPDNLKITGINEDENGELYFLTNPDTGPGNQKSEIYKIVSVATNTEKNNTTTNTNTNPDVTEGKELIAKSNCSSCHKPTVKLVGPSFQDIAQKYQPTAENYTFLTDKIIKGGSGNWGPVAMSPHADLPSADVKKMVTYILSVK